MDFLNVNLIKKASTSVATKEAWYNCRRTQKVNLKKQKQKKLTISISCNTTAQIYYKIQNTCALLGNKQYEFVSHTYLEKR